jgi:hypothetical protein
MYRYVPIYISIYRAAGKILGPIYYIVFKVCLIYIPIYTDIHTDINGIWRNPRPYLLHCLQGMSNVCTDIYRYVPIYIPIYRAAGVILGPIYYIVFKVCLMYIPICTDIHTDI